MKKLVLLPHLIYSQAPKLVYDNARIKLSFNPNLVKQDKVTYNHGPVVNIYVVYKLNPFANTGSVTLDTLNCLFGAVKFKKMLVLVNTNILDKVLDLIQKEVLHI